MARAPLASNLISIRGSRRRYGRYVALTTCAKRVVVDGIFPNKAIGL